MGINIRLKQNIELIEKNAGLRCNRGIIVNQCLQTDNKHIFSLGDVAELPDGKIYAYIVPIRHQAKWLAEYINDQQHSYEGWQPPAFNPEAKIHGFIANHPYRF